MGATTARDASSIANGRLSSFKTDLKEALSFSLAMSYTSKCRGPAAPLIVGTLQRGTTRLPISDEQAKIQPISDEYVVQGQILLEGLAQTRKLRSAMEVDSNEAAATATVDPAALEDYISQLRHWVCINVFMSLLLMFGPCRFRATRTITMRM